MYAACHPLDRLATVREFRDAVQGTRWHRACFAGRGDLVVGGSVERSTHSLHVWSRAFGQIVAVSLVERCRVTCV